MLTFPLLLAALTIPPPPPPDRRLLAWTMGVPQCEGEPVAPLTAVQPFVVQTWIPESTVVLPVAMRFRIDATGRPLGITQDGTGFVAEGSDIAPSLAANRFASQAHASCRVVYTARRMALEDAPIAEVRAFAIAPNVRPDKAVFARTFPADTDCFDPQPAVRLRAFPPFDTLPPIEGRIGWSMAAFDISAKGRPGAVRTVAGTRDPALDAATRVAVARSRFAPGARHGCVYPYYQNPEVTPAPPSPELNEYAATGSACPLHSAWGSMPPLVFPAAWNRRRIEGWAIVGFDVAPWGQTGNVHVLAAEPSSEFGKAGADVVRRATKAATGSGYTGCVEKVRFRVAARGGSADQAAD